MRVLKRSGRAESVKFDKILGRIKKQTYGLPSVDPHEVSKKVIDGVYDGVTTVQLDSLASEVAAAKAIDHPDYAILASRIAVTALHKEAKRPFSELAAELHAYIDPKTGEPAGLLSDESIEIVSKHKDVLDEAVVFDRDFNHDYFGFKTLERSYLLKMNSRVAETPQHMWMRVAVGIWKDNIDEVLKTYELLSTGMFTHATPTLFNAGTKRPQLSSCFLLTCAEDSLESIFKLLADCGMISKNAGGIGISIHNVRAKGAYIKGTGGTSNGIIPMLKMYNELARYVDQGGGKRKGSIAVYLEPWHGDIEGFLDLRKNHGKEEMRCRDLFLAMWTPDLFMKRVEENADWTLFSPDEAPGLSEVFDDGENQEFTALYEKYEKEGKGIKTIKARAIWERIVSSQIETGTPYVLFKDACNAKSNQKNLGTIKSSNLCCEILEYTSEKEHAVCNLASIALPKYLKKEGRKLVMDFDLLHEIAYQVAKNLNQVIDVNFYPIPEAEYSNLKNRPIGIGIQGLADLFAILDLPFASDEAKQLNIDIFETIYHASLSASNDLAAQHGPYESYDGSPASEGKLQYDLWGISEEQLTGRWDFSALKKKIAKHGLRNSLLLAPMPTASTAQIMGNNESIEAFTSNMYLRKTLSGEFAVLNKHLVAKLEKAGLWDAEMRDAIILNDGSIQNINRIPDDIKEVFKTVWEIKQKTVIDMAADRGRYICQSQSMNLFIPEVNSAKLTSALFYAWKKGLKTGMYYLRSKAASSALKGLGIDTSKYKEEIEVTDGVACSIDSPEDCLACGA